MIDAHPRHYWLVSGRENFGTLTLLSLELLNAHLPYRLPLMVVTPGHLPKIVNTDRRGVPRPRSILVSVPSGDCQKAVCNVFWSG
jgi:hypothetical protein